MLFLKNKFIPYYKNKKIEKSMLQINCSLFNLHHRKRYTKTTDKRKKAIILLQSHFRRKLCYVKLKKMQSEALKIQVCSCDFFYFYFQNFFFDYLYHH